MVGNYPSPEKNPKAFKDQLSHHLRFFRFNHKTNIEIAPGQDATLSIDEFFGEHATSTADDAEHHLLAR
jgi:hypothetical protein